MSKPRIKLKHKPAHPFHVIERAKRTERGQRMVEYAATAADNLGDGLDGFFVVCWDKSGTYCPGHEFGELHCMLASALLEGYVRRELSMRQEAISVLREVGLVGEPDE